jgi:hypothetical protein
MALIESHLILGILVGPALQKHTHTVDMTSARVDVQLVEFDEKGFIKKTISSDFTTICGSDHLPVPA